MSTALCATSHGAGMGRRAVLTAALGAVLAVGVGCSSTAHLEPLGVNLVNLEVEEITLFEATMLAQVRITNPNPDPIALTGGSLKLLLDGRKAGTALASEGIAVPAFDSALMEMKVHLNTASAITRIPTLLEKDTISYGVRGTFYSEGSWGRTSHPVERSGVLDLKEGRIAP